MVYKLVEVDGVPVAKRSSHKESHGGRKQAHRLAKSTGTVVEEIVHPADQPPPETAGLVATALAHPLVRAGEAVADLDMASARDPRRGGPAQPAVGRAEALPRRTRDPHPHGRRHGQA